MTEYGVMVNNQLIRHKSKHDGDKPIQLVDRPPLEEGFYSAYHFEDSAELIVQVWELIELPPMPEEEATTADYEEQLGRFGV